MELAYCVFTEQAYISNVANGSPLSPALLPGYYCRTKSLINNGHLCSDHSQLNGSICLCNGFFMLV